MVRRTAFLVFVLAACSAGQSVAPTTTNTATTVAKEQVTIAQFFGWAASAGHLNASPTSGLPRVKPRGDLPPFRTLQEIDATVARGGLSKRETVCS